MTVAPWLAAYCTAKPRFVRPLSAASTIMMLQFGQSAETISASSRASTPQFSSFWRHVVLNPHPCPKLITCRQPLLCVHGGRPNAERYVLMSFCGLCWYATTIATVWFCPADAEEPVT